MIKALVLLAFMVASVLIVRSTPVKNYLTPQVRGLALEDAGIWAPLLFILVYIAGICLFVPGTLLTALGAAIFGAYMGFLYVCAGAMLGASAPFWIGRSPP